MLTQETEENLGPSLFLLQIKKPRHRSLPPRAALGPSPGTTPAPGSVALWLNACIPSGSSREQPAYVASFTDVTLSTRGRCCGGRVTRGWLRVSFVFAGRWLGRRCSPWSGGSPGARVWVPTRPPAYSWRPPRQATAEQTVESNVYKSEDTARCHSH